MLYAEPDTPTFLAAILRLKQQQRRKKLLLRSAKNKAKLATRKQRAM